MLQIKKRARRPGHFFGYVWGQIQVYIFFPYLKKYSPQKSWKCLLLLVCEYKTHTKVFLQYIKSLFYLSVYVCSHKKSMVKNSIMNKLQHDLTYVANFPGYGYMSQKFSIDSPLTKLYHVQLKSIVSMVTSHMICFLKSRNNIVRCLTICFIFFRYFLYFVRSLTSVLSYMSSIMQ